jgi:dipeptidyl aminopeptidase/acylaminoacyl peptidase
MAQSVDQSVDQPQVAPYGSWASPITAAEAFAKTIGLSGIRLDGDTLYWSERRPDGRSVVVRYTPKGQPVDITPAGYNVRTRVHEYGGGDYIVADGTVYFSNFDDQRLYRQRLGEMPEALSTVEGMRYADACLDAQRRRLLLIREDHTVDSAQPTNAIVALELEGNHTEKILVAGNDFYSTPRLNADGTRLAWLTWNHPNMPWDAIELWVGEVRADGSIGQQTLVAGATAESLFQPEWSPDGSLYFVSDRTNWWNLYRWREADGRVEPLHEMAAEFGLPQWNLAISTYAVATAGKLVCSYLQNGAAHLASLDTHSLEFTPYELDYTSIRDLYATAQNAFFVGGSSTRAAELVRLDIATGATEVLRHSQEATVDPAYFSAAQPIEFPTDGGVTAHGFFYPPKNPDFVAPAAERPPLLVISHGGPTSAASSLLNYKIQFWTSRGFAVLDVDYGGSTGYGRDYRQRLKGQWGIVDVADCVNGAIYLMEQGLVDGERLTIDGGSAGGFTTLCALTFYDTFKAGASYFGVSDLGALARETHKFESRYLDGLIGPYPEERQLYEDRSPIFHTDLLARPMILLQGLEDRVVPPNQAEMMFEAVRARELPVAYITFPGEQHGFRKAENNQRALEAEFYFYAKVFGFDPADEIEPVPIENL